MPKTTTAPTKSKRPTTPKQSAAGKEIVPDLIEFRDSLRSRVPLESKFTVRTVRRTLAAPRAYKAKDVQRTREALNLCQALFAQLLGVSVKTVRGWEQGLKPPAPIARRFMDELNISPEHWKRRVGEMVHPQNIDS